VVDDDQDFRQLLRGAAVRVTRARLTVLEFLRRDLPGAFHRGRYAIPRALTESSGGSSHCAPACPTTSF